MAKKTLVSGKLVRGERWYIDYTLTDIAQARNTRHRKDFGLNEVADESLRGKIALHIIDHLEQFVTPPVLKGPRDAAQAIGPTLRQAIEQARDAKQAKTRPDTFKSYRSITGMFFRYLNTRAGGTSAPVSGWSVRDSQMYIDWLRKQKKGGYSPTTINNHEIILRSIWNEIARRHQIEKNPWTGIEPDRVVGKQRRAFEPDERRRVAAHIERNDFWLFRAILLQYYCYIRPAEITRLKFQDFNLKEGTVTIIESSAKNWKRRTATLPTIILPYFTDEKFTKYPGHYYVFGEAWKPNGTKHLHRDKMYRRHQRHLLHMKKGGLLDDITGLTWYSWKDTGITEHISKTSPIATRDQADHSDLKITLKYYHQGRVNDEYRNLPNTLFE